MLAVLGGVHTDGAFGIMWIKGFGRQSVFVVARWFRRLRKVRWRWPGGWERDRCLLGVWLGELWCTTEMKTLDYYIQPQTTRVQIRLSNTICSTI